MSFILNAMEVFIRYASREKIMVSNGMMTKAAARQIKEKETRPAPGRPRDPRTQLEILKAAAEILVEDGYRGLTMEGLATRAGVGKTTIYRRWKSLAELISDLLEAANDAWPMPGIADGTISDDLSQLYRNWVSGMSGAGKIIPIFIAEAVQNPELAQLLHERFVLPRRRLAIAMIDRAKSRGEVASTIDSQSIIDLFMGRMWYRQLVTGEPVLLEDEDKVIQILLSGLRHR
jgi:AcrR family transcriptional regulator